MATVELTRGGSKTYTINGDSDKAGTAQKIDFVCSYSTSGVLTIKMQIRPGSYNFSTGDAVAAVNYGGSKTYFKNHASFSADKNVTAVVGSTTRTMTSAGTYTVYYDLDMYSGGWGPTPNGGWYNKSFTVYIPGSYTVPGAGTTSCSMSSGTFTITWSGFTNGTNNAITTYELWYQESTNNSTWSDRVRVPGYTNRLSPRSFTTTFGTVGRYYRFCAVALGTVSGTYSSISAWGNSVQKTAGKLATPTWKAGMDGSVVFGRYSGSDNWSHTLSWNSVSSATSNTLSSYNVQAKYPDGTWYDKYNGEATSATFAWDGYTDELCPIKLRIQARGSAGSSYYSNYSSEITVYVMNRDVSIFTGSKWRTGKIWIYTSSGWKLSKTTYLYNGSVWKKGKALTYNT